MTYRTFLAAALVGSTALAPAALAQTQQPADQAQQAPQATESRAGQQMTAEMRERMRTEPCTLIVDFVAAHEDSVELTADEARELGQSGDAEACRAELTRITANFQTDDAGNLLDQQGNIVVTTPEPTVTVDQPQPEVTVNQPDPTVNVSQPQPEIVVRQAQPTVRFSMPKPTITIDQPQPEIIVRMPSPNVDVQQAQPQVSVRQGQPEISVQQPRPRVRVEMPEPQVAMEEQGQAKVRLNESEPVVRMQDDGDGKDADVNIERAEGAEVTYERAQANVEFDAPQEATVRYNQTGEPKIRYEQMSDEETRQAQRDEAERQQTAQQDAGQNAQQAAQQNAQQAAQQNAGQNAQQNAAQTAQQDDDPYAALRETDQRVAAGDPTPVRADQLIGAEVINLQGEDLGDVEEVVIMENKHYLIVSHGGFLGIGEDEVALPLERVSMRGDEVVLRGMTEEEIEAMPEMNWDNAQRVRPADPIQVTGMN